MNKIIVIAAYAIAVFMLVYFREPLIAWLKSDSPQHQVIWIWLIGLIIAIVPVIPYGIAAAAIGAKYGIWIGSLMNMSISVLAALILFATVRFTFSEEGRANVSKFKGVRYISSFAENNAFWAIMFARLLPIVPAQAINLFAAITRIPWRVFLTATIVGKLPFIVTVTIAGDRIYSGSGLKDLIVLIVFYGSFLGLVYLIYRIRRQKHLQD